MAHSPLLLLLISAVSGESEKKRSEIDGVHKAKTYWSQYAAMAANDFANEAPLKTKVRKAGWLSVFRRRRSKVGVSDEAH